MDDTAKLIVIVLIGSFAIERITASVNYIVDTVRLLRLHDPEAEDLRAKQLVKFLLLVVAGGIALGVVAAVDLRILRVLKMSAPPAVDFWLTWLVLFAGADRVRAFLHQGGSGSSEVPVIRIQVEGREAEVIRLSRAS